MNDSFWDGLTRSKLASYGFVVCAVEHRDGSGPRSFINHPPNYDGVDEHEKIEKRHGANKGPIKRRSGHDVVVSSTFSRTSIYNDPRD